MGDVQRAIYSQTGYPSVRITLSAPSPGLTMYGCKTIVRQKLERNDQKQKHFKEEKD
jgi:hypothetical protein